MKRLLLSICLLSGYLSWSLAQTGVLELTINEADGTAVPYASVFVTGLDRGDLADSLGRLTLTDLPYGEYDLQVSSLGYRDARRRITVGSPRQALRIELSELINELDEIVVTGTMKAVRRSQSIVPVEIYTPAFLRQNPTPSFFDALQNVNGVRPQLQCSVCATGDIHINGMEGPYTMVLIDGMPIVSGLSTVYGLNGIPNSIVDRIEIVKGPAAALYGSEAMGGIINVITKNPGQVPRFALDINGTGYGEINTDVATGLQVGDRLRTVLSANYFHFDQRYDINNDNFTDIPLVRRASVFNKWSLARPGNRTADLAFRYLYEDRFGGEMNWERPLRGTDSIYGESIYTNRWELIGNYQLPLSTEKVVLNYSLNRHVQDSYYGDLSYYGDQAIAFAQLLWDKQWGKRHDLLLGVSQRYTYYDDNTPVTATDDLSANDPQRHLLVGGFVQNEWRWSDRWKVLFGLRYDRSNYHGDIWSPRLSAKWQIDEQNALRFSSGNGFRVVNVFSEDHAALTGGREVVIAPSLDPERSWNGNINYTRYQVVPGGYVNIDASAFYTYYDNRIIPDFETNADQVRYENLDGYAQNFGASLRTDWAFTNGLTVSTGVTWVNAFLYENGTRAEQIQTPRLNGNYAVGYTIPRWQLKVDFTGLVNSPMILPVLPNDYRPERSPWFNISNLQVSRKWRHGLEFYGGVKNIFNFFPDEDPLLRPFDPFDRQVDDPVSNPQGYTFDTAYNYAPIQRARAFFGVRWTVD
jgi:outer membrane receptor for ferrienterochelin and colicins